MAVLLFMTGLSAAIGEAFVCMFTLSWVFRFDRKTHATAYFPALSADPLLIWNYGTMAILSFASGIGFWLSVRNLDRHEDELNNLPEGHLVSEKQ